MEKGDVCKRRRVPRGPGCCGFQGCRPLTVIKVTPPPPVCIPEFQEAGGSSCGWASDDCTTTGALQGHSSGISVAPLGPQSLTLSIVGNMEDLLRAGLCHRSS